MVNDENLIDDGRVAVHGKFVNVLTLNFQNDLTNTRKKQLLNFRFLNLFFLEDMQVNKLKYYNLGINHR